MKGDAVTSRREFLRTGVAGLAGAAFLCSGSCSSQPEDKSQDSSKGKPQETGSLIYRTLGRTGLRLPIVSMGSVYAIGLVRSALEEGVVYIHTSSGYAERNHERLLGEVFRDLPRSSFVIGTSPDLPYRFEGGRGRSLDIGREARPELISESLESSLKRLGLDYVDIYYLASVGSRETALHEPYMKQFLKLKEEGKTRYTGVATHRNEPEVIRAATESGLWDIVLTAFNFRQSYRDEIRREIRGAAEAGLGVVAMKTQAGVYWDRGRRRKINMKGALKWVLGHENVHTAIPAFSNFDEMKEDLSVMQDLTLTPEEKRDLRLGRDMGYSGSYCQGCGDCLAQCRGGVDIPALMRSHMYAFSYNDRTKAGDTLRHWGADDLTCASCAECKVKCTLGLDVRSRALEVGRILGST